MQPAPPLTPDALSPHVWRFALPSATLPPFTTTNLYLVHEGGVAVIVDPGSAEPEAYDAVEAAMKDARVQLVKGILLTHTHPDHCAGAEHTQGRFDAPVYVHPLELPRLELSRLQALNGERTLTVGGLTLKSLHTPGHSPGHLCYYLPEEKILLAGDTVANGGSVWVGLPEGDMAQYLGTLETLIRLESRLIGAGHGETVAKPLEKLRETIAHRLKREEQVLTALKERALELTPLREAVYPGLNPLLIDLADKSLLAHLKKLMNEMRVLHLGSDEKGPYRTRS